MKIDFDKGNGLVPCIIQDDTTSKVLMMGYMNQAAVDQTLADRRITFFSRSKGRLWTKGEESGHYLDLISLTADCDSDTLLAKVKPHGPVCHTGTDTCWGESNAPSALSFLAELEATIALRKSSPSSDSYTSQLFSKGINKIAQKVGEEAVELVIEAKDDNKELFLGEAADLLYHYLVLLHAKGFTLEDVSQTLKTRSR
ncbi:MAG: bifunctional phosphoribosyl-AMP cyclohydrolase/phosphoribosyl-ATP diphosphatase [Bacteroidetes bacterium]|nr:bifunctional phosphoribosyl-AMP cyclohydrolase/phosphoribosyl-ATP diphosphatase [Bacteroidota bacterium]